MEQGPASVKDVELCVAEYLYVSNRGVGKDKAAHLAKGLVMLYPEWSKKRVHGGRSNRGINSCLPCHIRPCRGTSRVWSPSLWRVGYERHALGVLLAHDCLLRVSELCHIKASNVADVGDA